MSDRLLNLWISRLYAMHPGGLPAPTDFDTLSPASQAIISALNKNRGVQQLRRHVTVLTQTPKQAREATYEALRYLSYQGARQAQTHATSVVPAYLVVDIPVPSAMSPTALVHRMVRRLYFAAVLQGLGELEILREAVMALRRNYLQCRGDVSLSNQSASKLRKGFDVGLALDFSSPLTLKLTASEEVQVVEQFGASLPRADLFESEDQLLADLKLLSQLELLVSRNAELSRRKMPRWEQVRSFFKNLYEPIRAISGRLELRPVFVLEATSVAASVTAMRFLADACALASSFEASIVLSGGLPLAALWKADEARHHAISRGFFATYCDDETLNVHQNPKLNGLLSVVRRQLDDKQIPAEVLAALDEATAVAATPATGQ